MPECHKAQWMLWSREQSALVEKSPSWRKVLLGVLQARCVHVGGLPSLDAQRPALPAEVFSEVRRSGGVAAVVFACWRKIIHGEMPQLWLSVGVFVLGLYCHHLPDRRLADAKPVHACRKCHPVTNVTWISYDEHGTSSFFWNLWVGSGSNLLAGPPPKQEHVCRLLLSLWLQWLLQPRCFWNEGSTYPCEFQLYPLCPIQSYNTAHLITRIFVTILSKAIVRLYCTRMVTGFKGFHMRRCLRNYH